MFIYVSYLSMYAARGMSPVDDDPLAHLSETIM